MSTFLFHLRDGRVFWLQNPLSERIRLSRRHPLYRTKARQVSSPFRRMRYPLGKSDPSDSNLAIWRGTHQQHRGILELRRVATPPLPRREAGYIPVYQSSTSPGTISATVTYCPGSGAGPPTSAGPWTNIHKTGDREISRPVARTREESADWGRRTSGTHTRQAASWERPHHAIASSRRAVLCNPVPRGPRAGGIRPRPGAVLPGTCEPSLTL